jgi:cation diffusion facilitator family transporter
VSFAVKSALILAKVVVGLVTGSLAILADAIHSLSDLVSVVIVGVALRTADSPPDRTHPFGHGKAENLASLFESILLAGAAGVIAWTAVGRLAAEIGPTSTTLGIVVMSVDTVIVFTLARFLGKAARKLDSASLEVHAVHVRADGWTSLAVLAGISIYALTGWTPVDSLLAIGVSALLLWQGVRLGVNAASVLLDARLPPSEIATIGRVVGNHAEVSGFHRLRTRKAGAVRHIDLHVTMDDDLTLRQAHRIAEDIEDRIRERFPNADVLVHPEPAREEAAHQRIEHAEDESRSRES